MSNGILIWWVVLCVVACINIGLWIYTATWLKRRKHLQHPVVYKHRRWLLWLSAIYVFVCAFRSFLPRVDVMRIGLVDSWLSSIFVGRTFATIAETCFIIELCLLIYLLGKYFHVRFSVQVAILIVPLIVLAEAFSWYAVLTTNNAGHVVENSIWTLSSVLMVLSLVIMHSRVSKQLQPLLTWMIIFGIGYFIFMSVDNVPMYVSRWQDDVTMGKEYMSFSQGMFELLHHWTVTFEWNSWRDDIGWQTLYFSTAVWLSIALVYIQPFETSASNIKEKNQLNPG